METAADGQARQEELKKKGAEYFEKVLAQASAGQDPFLPAPPVGKPREAQRAHLQTVDADLETVGLVLEGSRYYVLVGLWVTGSAASLVLAKASLSALPTPAILVFLHLLPVVLSITALASWSGAAVDLGPLTLTSATGSLPITVLSGLQVLLMFALLKEGTVQLALGSTAVVPQLVRAVYSLHTGRSSLQPAQQLALGAGSVGVVILLLIAWPNHRTLAFVILWTAAEAGYPLWEQLKEQAAAGQELIGGLKPFHVNEVAQAEAAVNRVTLVFYKSALPAVPVLIFGFIFQEGKELVDNELYVPAVGTILLSCLAWTLMTVSGMLILDQVRGSDYQGMLAASYVLTMILDSVINGLGSAAAFIGALLSIGGAIGFQHLQTSAQRV